MMKTDIQTGFDNVATCYDEQRKKFIPCFDDFYGCAVEALELENKHPHILDLGAGTGLLSQMVLQKHPTATIDLIDLSEKMLEVAKERFRSNDSVKIQVGDYTANLFEKQYDAIVSSLSIHHLTDADKVKLYANIFSHLKPSGIFVNAEQVLGEDDYIEQKYRDVWESYVEQSGLSKEEIQNGYERVKLDIRTPLSTQLNWLKDIGFSSVTCLYKHYSFAVMFARKV